MQRFALAVAGIGMLAATAATGPAVAQNDPKPSAAAKLADQVKAAQSKAGQSKKASATPADTCFSSVAWVTAAGQVGQADITPQKPPKPPTSSGYVPYPFVGVRASAAWYLNFNSTGTQLYMTGLFLSGANLYRHTTYIDDAGFHPGVLKVGSGWTSFKTIATSNYSVAKPRHSYLYGLNSDGYVYRYVVNGNTFKALGKFGGFSKFKTMTVIAENPSYDTLLMTTNAGALYTIRIPITATAKPVVKLIRSGGWQNFESLSVQGCGEKGGLLITAIDRDTDTGYEYAMSKANGAATALTGYGKIPAGEDFTGAFDGTAEAAITTYYDQLVSE
ncbi:hypothetical protein [Kribbella sp. NPDC055071]